jgi:hypothetical protein
VRDFRPCLDGQIHSASSDRGHGVGPRLREKV